MLLENCFKAIYYNSKLELFKKIITKKDASIRCLFAAVQTQNYCHGLLRLTHITVPDQQEHTLSPSPLLAALYEEF